jgi:hypothetical protein
MTPALRPSRSRLLGLLSEACEIEHGLACSYLFAAFSLRRETSDGLSWEQCQRARLWAAQVYFIAGQEMLHLAQAWNLLTALGGTPWWGHPPFPQERGFAPVEAALTLEPYGEQTLERFIAWERPRPLAPAGGGVDTPKRIRDGSWDTVGALYDRIQEIIDALPEDELFIGERRLQIGPELADFPDLVRVVDRASAAEAIGRIQHQGEGAADTRRDSHHGIFVELLEGLRAAESGYQAALPVLPNPDARRPPPWADAAAVRAIALFDDLYELMLRALGWVFGRADPSWPQTRALAAFAIHMMPMVIEPMGRALARIPLAPGRAHAAAGFALGRVVSLPESPAVATRLVLERLEELEHEAAAVAQALAARGALAQVAAELRRLRGSFNT